MRSILISLALMMCVAGCATTNAAKTWGGDLPITFNDYGFSSHSRGNPYTVEEIGQANRFIEERLEFYKVHHVLVVYLVPTTDSNRLVFIPTRPGYEPSKELYDKIAKDVEQFFDSVLETRPWNQKAKKK